jgi:ribonuclease PH
MPSDPLPCAGSGAAAANSHFDSHSDRRSDRRGEDRSDGRSASELRPLAFQWDPMGFALASLTIVAGRTRVLCSVCLEPEVPRWRRGSGQGWLSAEYRLLPASTPERQTRELMKLSGRTQEIQRLIGRSLRAALDLEALGERSLLVDCDVIQADAGTRTASVTGAWMALSLALHRLRQRGELNSDPLRHQVAAVSVGLVDGRALLDLDYSEDSRAEVDLNVVGNECQELLEVQGTAEGAPFSRRQLDALLTLAESGIATLQEAQRRGLAEVGVESAGKMDLACKTV